MKKLFLFTTALFSLAHFATAQNTSPFWSTAGNNNATSTSKLGTTNAINLRIFTNNVERVRVSTSGNVGVGTTTPLYKLHVVGNALITTGLRVSNEGINATNAAGIGVLGTGTTYGVYGNSTSSTGQGVFGNGGLIGVLGKSSLNGGNGIRGEVTGANAYGVAGIGGIIGVYGKSTLSGANGVRGEATASDAYGVAGIGGLIGVYGKSSLNGGNGVRGEATGNDAYGVSGTSTSSYGVSGVSSSSYGVNGISSSSYGVYGNGYVGVYASSSAFNMGDAVKATAWGTSEYGINAFSSQSYGVFGKTGNSSSYAGYFAGNVYSSGSYEPSDRNLKRDITNVTSAMEIIKKLQPKSYTYKQDGDYKSMNLPGGKHYGLIAQEVEEVLPNLVKATTFINKGEEQKEMKSTTPSSKAIEFKALNYKELIPIIIRAMQEQEARIQEQDAKIEALTQLLGKQRQTSNTSIKISSTLLDQNVPNPFTNSTSINYILPEKFTKAQVIITDKNGKTLQSINISGSGRGTLKIDASKLASGTYNYTLVADGKVIGTKQMISIK